VPATAAIDWFELVMETVAPPDDAAPLSVTEMSTLCPPVGAVGALMALNVKGLTVSFALLVVRPSVAALVTTTLAWTREVVAE
jgi:hypothetical protein